MSTHLTDSAVNDASPSAFVPPQIPPLEQGDRLSRAEFERRYQAMPHVKKAELINGVVHMPSPVRFVQHGAPHFDLSTWLGVYKAATLGTKGADNSTIRLDLDNEPQPDLLLLTLPEYGGQAKIDADGYVQSGPELVAEIAASSESFDVHGKLPVYRRNAVREYIIWRVLEQQVDWFALEGTEYRLIEAGDRGVLCSRIYPGLWLDVDALIAGDSARVLATLQEGLASPDHAPFVKQLAAHHQAS